MSRIVMAAALALAITLPAVSAQAQSFRTFVSATGSDSNNCTNVASPCRHLQAAYAATTANGEIYVLDPANYGSLTITHAVSIEGHGWASIAPPSGGNAITINANTGEAINIIGVVLDGTGLAGTNGIVFNSGGSLTVADSVVRNFTYTGSITTGNGIIMQPTSDPLSFVITNTIVSNNGAAGISYLLPSGSSATANGVIDHVVATNNGYGIAINTANGGGATKVAIANSTASNNSSTGIHFQSSASLAASIDNTAATSNALGIDAFGTVNVLLSRSVIQGNATGITNNTSPNAFYTYGNNLIDLNGSNITSPLNATVTLR
jgi:hypothetical protein